MINIVSRNMMWVNLFKSPKYDYFMRFLRFSENYQYIGIFLKQPTFNAKTKMIFLQIWNQICAHVKIHDGHDHDIFLIIINFLFSDKLAFILQVFEKS